MTENDKVQTTDKQTGQELVHEDELPIVAPAADIRETEDAFVLTAAMPGVDETSTDVTIEDSVLTIEGKTVDEPPAGHDLLSREFGATRYRRSFDVSEGVAADQVKARVKHGILEVTLPKAEEARPRRINIQVG